MREVPASMQTAWLTGDFIGDRRPVARATVQHPTMKRRHYTLMSTWSYKPPPSSSNGKDGKGGTKGGLPVRKFANGGTPAAGGYPNNQDSQLKDVADINYWNNAGGHYGNGGDGGILDPSKGHKVNTSYQDFLFSNLGKPLELPNITGVSWSRSIDAEVAQCTITLANTRPLEIGEAAQGGALDQPGWYTPTRGGSLFSSRWQQQRNEWFGMLMPDNLIRTYEGYGSDPTKPPELDPFLVQTGLWIIDRVEMTHDGQMTISCSDIGRILQQQYYWRGIVPPDFLPNGWSSFDETFDRTKNVSGKLKTGIIVTSNLPWNQDKPLAGHKKEHAFDGDPNTYWLSVGNVSPSRRFAYEWVETLISNQSVSEIKIRTKKKGYNCYVSVRVKDKWQGTEVIDYHRDQIGLNDANIPYVKQQRITSEDWVTIKLPKTYKNVYMIRVTLGNLQYFPGPWTYKYRAGIRDLEVIGATTKNEKFKLKPGPAGSNNNRYNDYTDLVKLFCAWSGFFWPTTGKARVSDATGTYRTLAPEKPDEAVLGKGVKGRVWGDFQQSGTTGPNMLSVDNFDKKTMLDCIVFIRDTLGFLFTIDETGGIQWRLPNITDRGNWITSLATKPGRTGYVHPIDERRVIMQLSSSLDGKNVREANYVGDWAGKLGAYAPGWNPNPTGLMRFLIWTDAGFAPETDKDGKSTIKQVKDALELAEGMADMISLRQVFDYRKDRIRIPANPAIQIDDQCRVNERVTAEGYLHYVSGISSQMDVGSGQWTYDLETFWLGFDPKSKWLFHPEQLTGPGRGMIRRPIYGRNADKFLADLRSNLRRPGTIVIDDPGPEYTIDV